MPMYGVKPLDPCRIKNRCHNIPVMMRAKRVSQLKMLFNRGCHGKTEQYVYKARLHQLFNHHADKPLNYILNCYRLKIKTSGPCMSRYRCRNIAAMMRAKNTAQLSQMYQHGCHGYAEQALHAFRLYQLTNHRVVRPLLQSMPRGISDMASFSWIMEDGTVETSTDMAYDYGTVAPYDELPVNGCRHGSPVINRKYFYEYYKTIFILSTIYRSYLPRIFMIANFYGHHYSTEWKSGGANYLGNDIGDDGMFDMLIYKIKKMDPKLFHNAIMPLSGIKRNCPPPA